VFSLLALIEWLFTPAYHDLVHLLLVGLGQTHSAFEVTNLVSSRLNVLPHSCKNNSVVAVRASSRSFILKYGNEKESACEECQKNAQTTESQPY
jgi:hypothetical protein